MSRKSDTAILRNLLSAQFFCIFYIRLSGMQDKYFQMQMMRDHCCLWVLFSCVFFSDGLQFDVDFSSFVTRIMSYLSKVEVNVT